MTEKPTRQREVPEDQSRKQILTYSKVRDYLRLRSNDSGYTYSQQLEEWLPEDHEEIVHEHPDEDIVNIKATPYVHDIVTSLAGKRVKPGDIVAYYAMLAAVDNGDLEFAAEMAVEIPDILWEIFEFDNRTIADGSNQ